MFFLSLFKKKKKNEAETRKEEETIPKGPKQAQKTIIEH